MVAPDYSGMSFAEIRRRVAKRHPEIIKQRRERRIAEGRDPDTGKPVQTVTKELTIYERPRTQPQVQGVQVETTSVPTQAPKQTFVQKIVSGIKERRSRPEDFGGSTKEEAAEKREVAVKGLQKGFETYRGVHYTLTGGKYKTEAARQVGGERFGEFVKTSEKAPTYIAEGATVGLVRHPGKAAIYGGIGVATGGIGTGLAATGTFGATAVTIGGIGLGTMYAKQKTEEIKAEPTPESRLRKIGEIGSTELAPLAGGGYVGRQITLKGIGWWRTRGMKEIPIEKVSPHKTRFPEAPQKTHKALFEKGKYKLPTTQKGEKFGYHTAGEPIKGTTVQPGKMRPGEPGGLHISTQVSKHFGRVSSTAYKILGIEPPTGGKPTTYYTTVKGFKTPKSFGKPGKALVQEVTYGQKGYAYVPGTKAEIQAIVPVGTEYTIGKTGFYTTIKGVRTPIYKLATVPGAPVTPPKIPGVVSKTLGSLSSYSQSESLIYSYQLIPSRGYKPKEYESYGKTSRPSKIPSYVSTPSTTSVLTPPPSPPPSPPYVPPSYPPSPPSVPEVPPYTPPPSYQPPVSTPPVSPPPFRPSYFEDGGFDKPKFKSFRYKQPKGYKPSLYAATVKLEAPKISSIGVKTGLGARPLIIKTKKSKKKKKRRKK